MLEQKVEKDYRDAAEAALDEPIDLGQIVQNKPCIPEYISNVSYLVKLGEMAEAERNNSSVAFMSSKPEDYIILSKALCVTDIDRFEKKYLGPIVILKETIETYMKDISTDKISHTQEYEWDLRMVYSSLLNHHEKLQKESVKTDGRETVHVAA